MKKIYCYLFISLLWAACSSRRFKASSLEKEHLLIRSTVDSGRTDSLVSTGRRGSTLIDRMQYGQVAEIIPEGEFQFDPMRGFTGKAQKITLSHIEKKERLWQDSSSRQTAVLHKMRSRQDTDKRQRLLKEQKKETRKSSSIRWWLIGVVLCLLAAWLGYRCLR